ncbi:DMT family transporter [Halorubrum sp. BV1]|uniref:DMT family transporter n=1 Tax=Halorubrum sp. BV1 TaxID=1498500 RepID=UPI000679DB74|nr:DMT family transporter [Halorubrum sp. BV1]
MDPGISFAVLAAVAWGGYIFSLKRLFSDVSPAALTVLLNSCAVVWYVPVVVSRTDVSRELVAGIEPVESGIVALTVLMHAIAFMLFLWAIDDGDLSYVTPISKIVPVFVLPVEVLLLGQVLTRIQVLGVVVATVAVYVVNYEPGNLLGPIVNVYHSRPAQFALLSAMCYAAGDVGKRVVLQEIGMPTALWVPTLLVGISLILLPSAVRHPPSLTRRDIPRFVGVAAIVALAEHTTTTAFAILPASIASPIVNTQAVIAVVLGGVLLGERYFRLRLFAAVMAVLGVTLIAL